MARRSTSKVLRILSIRKTLRRNRKEANWLPALLTHRRKIIVFASSCRNVKIVNRYGGLPKRSTSKVLRMLLSAGFFHCQSQKVKGVYSLILLEKIKVQTRKLAIDSSKY